MLKAVPHPEQTIITRSPGFELRDEIFAERGELEAFAQDDLVISSLLTPVQLRVGGASRQFKFTVPSVLVDPPDDYKAVAWEGRFRIFTILLSTSFVENAIGGPIKRPAEAKRELAFDRSRDHRDMILQNILASMAADARNGNASGPAFLETLAIALVGQSLPSQAVDETRRGNGLSARQLATVLELIESRLASKLSLEELAASIAVSTSYLCRAFRLSTGLPPHQYIIQRRVERARSLIAKDNLTLNEVALATGFFDQSRMATTFRKVLNAPPSFFVRDARRSTMR